MPLPLLILQIVTLLAVVFLLLRKQQAPEQDSRLAQIPDQLTRLDARNQALDEHIRNSFVQMRNEIAAEAQRTREANEKAFTDLRTEVIDNISRLGSTLNSGLADFRGDNKDSDNKLREAVQGQMDTITRRIAEFTKDTNDKHTNLRESLNAKLNELMASNTALQNQLREAVEQGLAKLNETNTAKLEEMRVTVDEKLHKTLQSRLTESFSQVTTHLGEVQKGLGEMKELATGVNDLKKVFSNVKSRGVVGEFFLERLMEQIFTTEQYVKNAHIKAGSQESVEFALRIPIAQDEFALLAIDSKFPQGDWERLEQAYETGEGIDAAGKAFERAIRAEGKRICDKYIDEPTTLPYAIMYLPTESLYAEVLRRAALVSELQQICRVSVVGPSNFMHMMSTFQMAFRTMAIQKKGSEVWKILGTAKSEFEKFGGLMDKVEKQVGTVQKTIQEINSKTTTINRALKNVSSIDSGTPIPNLIAFEDGNGIAPLLAASGDENDDE